MKTIFGRGGLIHERMGRSYEPRAQQLKLATLIQDCISRPEHGIFEAPTGCGKSFAYLAPAMVHAVGQTKDPKPVIISTATVLLQDQLKNKDLPFLCDVMAGTLHRRPEYVVLKGRANFLCPHRLAAWSASAFPDQHLPIVQRWAETTATGDRAELETVPAWWSEVSSDPEECRGKGCREDCFYKQQREAAKSADLVVVNHALYLAHVKAGGRILPPHDILIVDEAHQWEEYATSALTIEISLWRFVRACRRLVKHDQALKPHADAIEADARGFFDRLATLAEQTRPAPPPFPDAKPAELADAACRLDSLCEALKAKVQLIDPEGEAYWLLAGLGNTLDQLRGDITRAWDNAAQRDGWCPYVEPGGRRQDGTQNPPRLKVAPIEVSPLLAAAVVANVPCTIYTSATLAAGGKLGFMARRLGLGRATYREAVLPPVFDYAHQACLWTPANMPDPSPARGRRGQRSLQDPDAYNAAVVAWIDRLLPLSRGRAFLLFTSFSALRYAWDHIRCPWPRAKQGDMPNGQLLSWFRETEGAVLFGTNSFWEGADIPGDALRLVVIDKIPFAVPGDPLNDARCRAITRRGGNPFRDLLLPSACLRLKQGVGRLIRTAGDTGAVVILDPRLRSGGSRYAGFIRASLPDFADATSLEDVEAVLAAPQGGDDFAAMVAELGLAAASPP